MLPCIFSPFSICCKTNADNCSQFIEAHRELCSLFQLAVKVKLYRFAFYMFLHKYITYAYVYVYVICMQSVRAVAVAGQEMHSSASEQCVKHGQYPKVGGQEKA